MERAVEHDGYYNYPPLEEIDFYNENNESILLSFDEYGLRNPQNSLETARVLVIGDSFTSSLTTPEEDTIVHRLNQKGLKTYNAGVDGFSTFKAGKLLEAVLKDGHPEVVILNFYMGNDYFDNMLDPLSDGKPSYAKLPGIPKSGFCSLSRLCQFIHQKIYLGFFLGYPTNLMELYALKEMDSYQNDYDAAMQESVVKTKNAIESIALFLRGRGIKFVVVGIPSKAQVGRSLLQIRELPPYEFSKEYAMEIMEAGYSFDKPDQVLSQICSELGVPYHSLLDQFRGIGAPELYFQIDSHWNKEGQRVAAEAIYKILQDDGIVVPTQREN